jgi:hypothetical protein
VIVSKKKKWIKWFDQKQKKRKKSEYW